MADAPANSRAQFEDAARRLIDVAIAGVVLVAFLPVFGVVAVAIKLDSSGPVFFRCRRVGLQGEEFGMLKFRKMRGNASGVPLTVADDTRFTRIGGWLAKSKVDEFPQFWNVLRGEMSLVGPRPEDHSFVVQCRDRYAEVLRVKPGITGLCQLAFANEGEILDPEDRVRDYVERLLPQKAALDCFYVAHRSLVMDLRILTWTVIAVVLRRDVAVNRTTARLRVRRRPKARAHTVPTDEGLKA